LQIELAEENHSHFTNNCLCQRGSRPDPKSPTRGEQGLNSAAQTFRKNK